MKLFFQLFLLFCSIAFVLAKKHNQGSLHMSITTTTTTTMKTPGTDSDDSENMEDPGPDHNKGKFNPAGPKDPGPDKINGNKEDSVGPDLSNQEDPGVDTNKGEFDPAGEEDPGPDIKKGSASETEGTDGDSETEEATGSAENTETEDSEVDENVASETADSTEKGEDSVGEAVSSTEEQSVDGGSAASEDVETSADSGSSVQNAVETGSGSVVSNAAGAANPVKTSHSWANFFSFLLLIGIVMLITLLGFVVLKRRQLYRIYQDNRHRHRPRPEDLEAVIRREETPIYIDPGDDRRLVSNFSTGGSYGTTGESPSLSSASEPNAPRVAYSKNEDKAKVNGNAAF